MLKITAIGNLTHDVELKMNENTGKPYAILRIASDRRYKDKDGNKLTDFISIKVRGPLAERCAAFAWKGCKLAAHRRFRDHHLRGRSPAPARFPHQSQRCGIPVSPQGGGRGTGGGGYVRQ